MLILFLGFLLSQESTAVFVELSTCFKTGMSSLYVSCTSQEDYRFHCVLDDDHQPGIGCLRLLRVQPGLCPFFSKRYQELDTRKCVGGESVCPQVHFWSYDVYKYPGCLKRTLYTTVPPPTTSVKEISDELSDNVTDTCVGNCSNGSDTTLLSVFLVLFVVVTSCLIFLILFCKRKILKAYAVSLGCHICLKNANTGNQTESTTPVDLNLEGPNRI